MEAGLRVPKRRADWRLGRFAAKEALCALRASRPGGDRGLEDLTLAEVWPEAGGAPQAYWEGRRLPWTLSLSHSEGRALVAVDPGGSPVGCDIEGVEPRSPAFLREWFTNAEQRAVSASETPDLLCTLYWSAKESFLKAVGEGLRRPLHGVRVELPGTSLEPAGAWRALRVGEREGERRFPGFWRRDGESVLTVVAAAAEGPPVRLGPGTARDQNPFTLGAFL
jgi:4'-phosphopantetheinyl transferase